MMATILCFSALTLGGCERKQNAEPPAEPTVVSAPIEVPALPPPLVGRADLLEELDLARAAYAAGQANVGETLAGRRFAIRQVFGCQGASHAGETGADLGVARSKSGRQQGTVDISLTPADWSAAPVLAQAEAEWEAVEGYWLTRPWLRSEGCPAQPAIATQLVNGHANTALDSTMGVNPPFQTSGLAAVYAQGSSRLGRRDGKAFTLTLRGDPPTSSPQNGYRMVIEGRFSAFPDGRSIHCHSPTIDQTPVCVAAANIDRVAFEDADGKLLKEWRLG